MSHHSADWSQEDEITFIKGIGTHYQPGLHRTRVTYTRTDALRGYLAGLDLRTDWDGMNSAELRQIAEAELLLCESQEPPE